MPLSPSLAPTRGLELRDVLGFPFPSDLSAAPTGERVAWVFNEGGCRNIWIAHIGRDLSEARRLTNYRGDDGTMIGGLRWTAHGRALIYVRGTTFSDESPPNPSSAADAPRGPQVWMIEVDGASQPSLLGAGHSPEVAPVHGDVAWIHEGQVWHVDRCPQATGEACVSAKRLFRDRGTCRDLSWSPDSGTLAFVSDRGDHSLVGIYERETQAIRWMSPGVYRDIAPTWSLDGRQLAFIRLAESEDERHVPRRDGVPWSVWRVDVRAGEARAAWRAPRGPGSVFRRLSFGPQLSWTSAGSIVFPWEGSGWLHLNAIGYDETEALDLTPGDFELASMGVDRSPDTLLCVANKDDVDGCRIWRIEVDKPALVALTSELVVACSPVVTARGRVAALQADARQPLRPVWLGDSGVAHALADEALPADFPYSRQVDPRSVAFRSSDGWRINGQLFVPRLEADRVKLPRPAILHFHGGPTRQMFAAWHPMECYHLQYGLNQYLANQGYVVFSVNYRGGSGYGLDFREAHGLGAGGASEHEDALGAVHFLRNLPDVDEKRIGAYGVSYGGLMTALALSRASHLFAAGVDCAGISDWRPAFPQSGAETMQMALSSSPIATAGQWTSPVLFIHADDDREVPFSQTVDMVRTLDLRGGVDVECLVLPDEQHDFQRRESWERVFRATSDFFQRRLGHAS